MQRWALTSMLVLGLLLAGAPMAGAASQMEDLENALMCKCKDKCGKVLINCTCDTSKETRKDLQARLESGLTVDQIIQAYVEKHGETILSAPTKSGFNLSAWITPFVALVIGGVGVRQVLKNWMRKPGPSQQPSEESVSSEPPAAPSHSSRVQRELDRLED